MRSYQALTLLAAALAPLAQGGTVCLTRGSKALLLESVGNRMDVWPIQGNPCENDSYNWFDEEDDGDDLCAVLPQTVTICDKQARLVKLDGEGYFPVDGGDSDCGVRLEIDGEEYHGTIIRKRGICDNTCGGTTAEGVISWGSVAFEDVPICAPADPIEW
ncbi:hypothetical protein CSOJ01_13366 [Colletotrichum sojae]|uniref:Uncharacterized protein n=1 Tax=Colletotrichum sojae TaxID=2175907 RepID=A0A8H6ML84_9PEZI|nr:hypothetical protein CSOJ01_13366 [Colletotrichum sojae]